MSSSAYFSHLAIIEVISQSAAVQFLLFSMNVLKRNAALPLRIGIVPGEYVPQLPSQNIGSAFSGLLICLSLKIINRFQSTFRPRFTLRKSTLESAHSYYLSRPVRDI